MLKARGIGWWMMPCVPGICAERDLKAFDRVSSGESLPLTSNTSSVVKLYLHLKWHIPVLEVEADVGFFWGSTRHILARNVLRRTF